MARILVVDDEPQIAPILQTVPSAHGHLVLVVDDGALAVAQTESWLPEVVVLDHSELSPIRPSQSVFATNRGSTTASNRRVSS